MLLKSFSVVIPLCVILFSEFFSFCSSLEYPSVRRDESIVDDYFGVQIKDPYRWLEDETSPETQDFIKTQTEFTAQKLLAAPNRNEIRMNIYEMYNYPRKNTPRKIGDKFFYFANSGLQNHDVLYKADDWESETGREVFIDPNGFDQSRTLSLYRGLSYSPDGNRLAYLVLENGDDYIGNVSFKNTQDGTDSSDLLENVVQGTISWTKDSKGVFYLMLPDIKPIAHNATLAFYHRLGTNQSEDILLDIPLDDPIHMWLRTLMVTSDDKLLVFVNANPGYNTRAAMANVWIPFVAKIPENIISTLDFVPLAKSYFNYQFLGNDGSIYYFLSDEDSNGKIIAIDTETLNVTTILPEDPIKVIDSAAIIGPDTILVVYLKDVKPSVEVFNMTTAKLLGSATFEHGSVFGIVGATEGGLLLGYGSFLIPSRIYFLNLTSFETSIYQEDKVPGLDPEDYVIENSFYKSFDNTSIPISIIYKKNLTLDGNTPLMLYGYGGLGLSLTPTYQLNQVFFAQKYNGIIAYANIRGGGEYGRNWHYAAIKGKRQVAYNDFIAAAEYLINNNYTNPTKLVAEGASNGGLLMGVMANQRPDIFKVILARNGLMEMLRYLYIAQGPTAIEEFGDPRVPEEFRSLYAISPLHNLKFPNVTGVQYPSIFVATGEFDGRASCTYSYKYLAELQHTIGTHPSQVNPLLLRLNKYGHGTGRSLDDIIEEMVDFFSFIELNADVQFQK